MNAILMTPRSEAEVFEMTDQPEPVAGFWQVPAAWSRSAWIWMV